MIARRHRFHGHGSLRYVYQHGQVARGPLTATKYTHNKRRSSYRLAVVVSRKISKSAVVRNRIRRRIYEVVRRHEADMTGAFDLVITAYHAQLAVIPAQDLEKIISTQLYQAGVLKKPA